MKLSVRNKAAGAFGAALLLFVVLLWLAHWNIQAANAAALWRERSHETRAEIRELLMDAVNAETGQRGFLITGDESFLEPYQAALSGLPRHFRELRRLTETDPAQRARLAAIESMANARLALIAGHLRIRREEGREAAMRAVALGEGKRAMDQLRAALAELEGEEGRRLVEREAAVVRQTRRVEWTVLSGVLAGIGLVLAAFVALEREISERRRAEAASARHAEEVRDLYDNAPCGYHSLGPDGTVLRMNGTELCWLGYKREDLVGSQRMRHLLTPESAAKFEISFARFMQDGARTDLELEMVRSDGTSFPVLVSAIAVRDQAGGFVTCRATVFDISERKRLEEEYERLFEMSQDLVCIAGFDGFFKRVNPVWERVFGYTAQELTSSPFSEFLHPDDREATLAEFEEQLQAGKVVVLFENRYRCKDGSWRWLQWSSRPDSAHGRIYAIARDVTEQKSAQDEMRQARAAAEAANAELETFSYSVSHDLRSPLRAIDGFSQALLEDYGAELDSGGKDLLVRIRAGAQRMAQLIDDLLRLSRISRTELDPQPLDVSALVRTLADQVRVGEPTRCASFAIADGIKARADPRLLRVALENLLSNAWKFTRRKAAARIEFGSVQENGQRVYYLRDNGAGFDMAYAGKLFGPFQRLHHTRDFEGTGIGLATVSRIVHRHGGRVWAQGAPEHGATFFFTLDERRDADEGGLTCAGA
jgi:PAS domain S-box-containing protein